MSRAYLPLPVVREYEGLARSRGVSKVARSARGFLAAYKRAGGDPDRLSDEWDRKREAFLARHAAQMRGEPLWEADGTPTRRHLALIVWAWSPGRLNPAEAAAYPTSNPPFWPPAGGEAVLALDSIERLAGPIVREESASLDDGSYHLVLDLETVAGEGIDVSVRFERGLVGEYSYTEATVFADGTPIGTVRSFDPAGVGAGVADAVRRHEAGA